MSRFIGILRVQRSIRALQAWRSRVDSQGAMHLIHFLAAKYSGVNSDRAVIHDEENDRAFCDRVLRVRPGSHPYFDPLDNSFRIQTHFHSNVATARKKTFADRWKAATFSIRDGHEYWRFEKDYLRILVDNMLTKGGIVTRIPVYDLCAWIYREYEFADDAQLDAVKKLFVAEYNLSSAEFDTLFSECVLDGGPEVGEGFFINARTRPALLLRMLEDDELFDVADASEEISASTGRGSVEIDDLYSMVAGGRRQIIFQGPPGTGKTFTAKRLAAKILGADSSVEFFRQLFIDFNDSLRDEETRSAQEHGGWTLVQFHPSYSYEDFVRGIFADLANGSPTFAIRDRLFVQLCDLAARTKRPIVLIIDEINRTDLSKVLGELVYGIEYRGEPVSLQYVRDGSSALVVPENLIILGTMNTADHSIAHIDYAVRRRFDFIDFKPDRGVIQDHFSNRPVLMNNVLIIFDAVNSLLSAARNQAVGHSFFLGTDSDAVARSIVFQVLPLLSDYRREGILGDAEILSLPGWPGRGLPLYSERPFDLVSSLIDWLGQNNGSTS
jgi:MoxR-like ATPase